MTKQREKLIEEWIEEHGIVTYRHGQRPEGEEPPGDISVWTRRKKSGAEKQAAADALNEK